MRKCLIVLLALALPLSGCGVKAQEPPLPGELFAAIRAEVELPKMVDTSATELEALTGIGPDLYDSAVCCRLSEGTAPDEVIIIHCIDRKAAGKVQELLEKRLEYKRQSGERYLTEYQPMLQAGVVWRDGLTVWLVVSGQAEEIERVLTAAV